jgi:hypothetical protein
MHHRAWQRPATHDYWDFPLCPKTLTMSWYMAMSLWTIDINMMLYHIVYVKKGFIITFTMPVRPLLCPMAHASCPSRLLTYSVEYLPSTGGRGLLACTIQNYFPCPHICLPCIILHLPCLYNIFHALDDF